MTQKKERDEHLCAIRKANEETLAEEAARRTKVEIKHKFIYINNVPQKTHYYPSTVQQIFEMMDEDQQKAETLPYVFSDKEEDKENVFRGLAMCIKSATELRLAYKKSENALSGIRSHYDGIFTKSLHWISR